VSLVAGLRRAAGRGAQELAGAGGGGLNSQLVGDEVKLSFAVGKEENTRGYVITRRPGGSDDSAYEVVADYLTPGSELGAGKLNGEYSYVDGSVVPGTWVYRVAEEDVDGSRTVLSQTIIEVRPARAAAAPARPRRAAARGLSRVLSAAPRAHARASRRSRRTRTR
jgi:hypothetical protein